MKAPTELKVFEVGEDEGGDYGLATFKDHPEKVAIVAQNKQGQRRVLLVQDDMFALARLAQAACEIAGITKLQLKKRAKQWDIQFGPRPRRPWDEERGE